MIILQVLEMDLGYYRALETAFFMNEICFIFYFNINCSLQLNANRGSNQVIEPEEQSREYERS